MSIDSYFKRTTKVINDEPTPECSPHPSESSGSITAIPAMQVTPLQRQQTQDKEQLDNSLLSQSQTLLLGLANMERRRRRRTVRQRLQVHQKKSTLCGRWSSCCCWPRWDFPARPVADPDDDSVFADSSQAPCSEEESSSEEEAHVAAPAVKKWRASNPYRPGCCSTLLFPKDLPQGLHFLSRSGCPAPQRRRTVERSFDVWSGGCEQWSLVQCSNIHILAQSGQQGCDAGAQYEQQLHQVVQDSQGYIPDHAHSQAEVTASKEEISIKYF